MLSQLNVHLYNEFHAGDVFFSRAIIQLVKQYLTEGQTIKYHHNCSKGILKDLPYVTELPIDEYCVRENTIYKPATGELYINTWYGQGNFKFFNPGGGTTLRTIHSICQNICNNLFNSCTFIEDENIYPQINHENIPHCNSVFLGPNILICNDLAMSGQSNNMSFDITTHKLSTTFPNCTFFVTNKTFLSKSPNIMYIDDIFPYRPNLLEISKFSQKCSLILGRSSGPYSYCMSKDNITDIRKTFVSVANNYMPGIWDKRFHKCTYHHFNGSQEDKLTYFLTNELQRIVDGFSK